MRNLRPALFAVFAYLSLVQVAVGTLGLRQGARGSPDFRHLYTAGYMVRTGQGGDLYNYEIEEQLQNKLVRPERTIPFDHLAYEALFYVPFSFLKYTAAYFVFAGFNAVLLIAAAVLFRGYLAPLEALGRFVPEAMFFCFPPAVIAIILGQDSLVLLVLAVLACIALDAGHEMRAGLLLSAGLFKFQFILPVVLLFLLWRKWRFILGSALGGIAAAGLSVWVAGISGTRAFIGTMMEMSVGLSNDAQRFKFGTYPNMMPNLRGFIDAVAGSHVSPAAIQILVAVSTLVVILAAARMQPSLPLALLVAVLVSYHGLIHDSSLLILPLGMTLVRSVREENLALGIFDVAVFASPSILFQFSHSRYFPMAILLLALFALWRPAQAKAAPELRLHDAVS